MASALAPGGGMMGSDINLIHKLTSINDVNRLLHETLARERGIDSDLDRLLNKRAELERSFLLLNAPTVEMLELVHADCEQLLGSASSTAELATHISSKVRCLDTAQTAVLSVLSKISLILDCSTAISGVKAAMEAEDYEVAARHIATFTELDARLTASSGRASANGGNGASDLVSNLSADVGQAESQRAVLIDAQRKLEGVVNRQFDDAVSRHDVAAAVRFASLYKPLGKQEEGLKRFTQFMQLVVGSQVRAHVTSVSEQADAGAKVDWTKALSFVFKEVATALTNQEAFVRDTFGPTAVLDLATALQAECDASGGRTIARFMEARRVAALVREASSRRGKGSAAGAGAGGEGGLDHRALEVAISELLSLCRVTEEYNQFILGRMRQAAGGSLTSSRETSFRSGALNVGVRELLGHYMSLEEMYMYETASMAIRIDEVSAGSLTSSMVDDLFFILRKCGTRVLASGSVQVMCALLMELNNVAANQLRNALAQRLAPGPGRLLAAAPVDDIPDGGSGEIELSSLPPAAADYVVALNNSDVAADYMVKLKGELDGYLGDLFPGNPSASAERERVRGVLVELQRTAGEFRQSSSKAVEQLAEGILPRLKAALDEAAGVSYSLSEAEYSSIDAGAGGWVSHLVMSLKAGMVWMQTLLTNANYEGCVSAVLDKILSRIEALISRKSFTQLGGLALERDVRTLGSHMSDLTQRSIRDKFTRLNQMALLLQLESIEELRDYWGGDSAITWRLSAADVRAVLAQRTDFSRDALSMLHLV